jgi:nucleoside-diphosphate-sugar epimerase
MRLGRTNVTCLRFATACGMSDRLRLDLVLNDFVACAVATGEISVLSDGTPWRPLIDVADMARALEWAIGRDASAGGQLLSVNVGSDAWNFQVRDLARAVAAAVPGTRISINGAAPPDNRSYRVDFALYRRLAPRHQPESDLGHTIAGLGRGLRRIGFADADFRNSTLVRLKVLDRLVSDGLLLPSLRWRVPLRASLAA